MIFKKILLNRKDVKKELKRQGYAIGKLKIKAEKIAVFVWEREGREPVPFVFDKMCMGFYSLQLMDGWREKLQVDKYYNLGNCRAEVKLQGLLLDTGISKLLVMVDNDSVDKAKEAIKQICEEDEFPDYGNL